MQTINITIPNFTLDKEIGRGGMAAVYLGQQQQPKRKVAIKIVSPQGNDPKILEDLKKEGDTVAQFSHPNIVTVYECGVIDNHYYLAMEILSGGDLKQKIKQGLDEEAIFNIMLDICKALEHAHNRGTLHRDIKPENILFHEDGKAVLVDFGIAKARNSTSEFTRAGAVVGTPHYMSPERALGKEIDERSDLYAMGVVFYEMLIGKKLYDHSDTFAVSYAHVNEPIPKLPEKFSNYQHLLNRMLAKSPDDRFQNAGQLVNILKKHLRRLKPSHDTTHGFVPLNEQKESKIALYAILTLSAILLIFIALWLFSKSSETIEISQPSKLSMEQQLEMTNKIMAAESFIRAGNTKNAENLFETVLTQFDCHNQDARNRMKILNPEKLSRIIKSCE